MSTQTFTTTLDPEAVVDMPNALTSWAEFADGAVTLSNLDGELADLTPCQARYLAACLISCADYAEGVE